MSSKVFEWALYCVDIARQTNLAYKGQRLFVSPSCSLINNDNHYVTIHVTHLLGSFCAAGSVQSVQRFKWKHLAPEPGNQREPTIHNRSITKLRPYL